MCVLLPIVGCHKGLFWSTVATLVTNAIVKITNILNCVGSVAVRKGPRRFCPHHSDCCRVLMLTYRNSPLWQRCERCNNVLSCFGHHGLINWTAWSSRDVCVNWNELSVSRLQLYEQPSALKDAWVRTGGCKRRYPKVQSRNCYQECGCHLNNYIISLSLPRWWQSCLRCKTLPLPLPLQPLSVAVEWSTWNQVSWDFPLLYTSCWLHRLPDAIKPHKDDLPTLFHIFLEVYAHE